MNKNYLHKSLAALLAAAALTGCAKDKEEFHYIDLSQVACTFQGEDNQPLTVSVITAPAAWSAAPDASWVTAEKGQDGESLTITVEDNTSGTEREARITVSAGQASQQILVTQLAADNLFARLRKLDTFQQGAVISPSGNYVGGIIPSIAPDDSWLYSPVIIDLRTGETYQHGPFPEALYYMTEASCITDQGLLFINDGMHGGQVAIDTSGNIIIPEAVPAGFEGKPKVEATSADGKYWVGYAMDKNGHLGGLYHPLLWTDGVPEVLPMPEKGFREQELTTGVMARGISANGEVAYGTSWENYDFGMLYWKRNGNGFDAPQWVGKDVREMVSGVWTRPDGREYEYTYVNGIICQAWNTQVSPSGTWIAGRYRKEFDPETEQPIDQENYAAFYNTETEKTIIVEDYGESGGQFVTDDGIAFIGLGTLGVTTGKVYDLNTQTDLGDTADWAYDTYGIIIPTGYINYVSADGKMAFGTSASYSVGGISFIKWYIAPPLEKEK